MAVTVPGASEVYSSRSCALGDAQRHYYIGTIHAWKYIFYQSIWLLLLVSHPSIRIAQGENHSIWPRTAGTFTSNLQLSHYCTVNIYIFVLTVYLWIIQISWIPNKQSPNELKFSYVWFLSNLEQNSNTYIAVLFTNIWPGTDFCLLLLASTVEIDVEDGDKPQRLDNCTPCP